MTFSLAVDVGATFVKVARIDERGCVDGQPVRVPCPVGEERDGPGSALIDPDLLIGAVRQAMETAAAGETPEVIAVSNQMHGFVVVDEGCRAVYGAATWQDQRGSAALASIREEVGTDALRLVGAELRTGIPLATLAALRDRNEKLPTGRILSIGDWVTASLTGAVDVMHVTNAAAMGMLDVIGGAWDDACLDAAGLSRDRMPGVATRVETVGRTPEGSDVLVAVGDQQAALLGMELAMNEMSFNVATGAQVARLSDAGLSAEVQTRPYFDGLWLHTVTHIPAGRALNAWLRLLTAERGDARSIEQAWADLLPRIAECDDAALPAFNLAVFDSADGDRGSVEGVVEANLDPARFLRGALVSCAESLVRHAQRVGFAGLDGAVFSGGWMREGRVIAERVAGSIELPCRTVEGGEDALVGLGRLIAMR